MSLSPKSWMVCYCRDEWELEAHTGPSCSTHEYFGSWKDERLTRSQCWDSEILFSDLRYWENPYVNYLTNSMYFSNKSLWPFRSKKYGNFQFHPKQKKMSNILSMKSIDFYFYRNRSSATYFTRAPKAAGFWSKMSPGMSCSNGSDHIQYLFAKMMIRKNDGFRWFGRILEGHSKFAKMMIRKNDGFEDAPQASLKMMVLESGSAIECFFSPRPRKKMTDKLRKMHEYDLHQTKVWRKRWLL